MRHEAQNREDDKAGEDRCAAVNKWHKKRVSETLKPELGKIANLERIDMPKLLNFTNRDCLKYHSPIKEKIAKLERIDK